MSGLCHCRSAEAGQGLIEGRPAIDPVLDPHAGGGAVDPADRDLEIGRVGRVEMSVAL